MVVDSEDQGGRAIMTTSVRNALDAPATKPQWRRDRGNQHEAAGTQKDCRRALAQSRQ